MNIVSVMLVIIEGFAVGYALWCWADLLSVECAIAAASAWVPVEATLYSLDTEIVTNFYGKKKTIFTFYAQFEKDGREFGVHKISFGHQQWAQSRAWARQADRAPSDTVTIMVNPKRPHENVALAPDRHPRFWLALRAVFMSSAAAALMGALWRWWW